MSQTSAALWDLSTITPPCDTAAVDPTMSNNAQSAAQQLMWALSGRRAGNFTTVNELYQPTRQSACMFPYKAADGQWRNGYAPGYGSECCEFQIEQQPVQAVTAVRVEGVLLDAADYSLQGSTLLRIGQCWPSGDECQVAPISIDYTWGLPPTAFTLLACAELMCEFLAGWSGNICRLPSRVTSIARQGVTMELDSPTEWAAIGMTGLPTVDAWVRTVNPNGIVTRSRFYSPDLTPRVG